MRRVRQVARANCRRSTADQARCPRCWRRHFGLPPAEAPATYEVKDYKPKLTLEGLAQPTIAVGASRFGAAVGGGIALQFGDMLGDHILATAVQLNSGYRNSFSPKDIAAQAIYYNQANRWNWGVLGGQVPYLSGGFQSSVGRIGGELVEIDEALIFRQTEQSAAGLVAYPFDRARRVEFQGGVTRIMFDQIVETSVISLRTGELLGVETNETSLASPLSLATASAAYVYDTSNYGATSPVQGQRYRFEASPTFGSVQYASLLADYRRYFMPASFYTFAVRGMHYGRYGSGSEDTRLFPLFIGYPNLVRGYDVGTFESRDCVSTATSECPAFDRLVGSRVLVGNVEFRFPLLRPFGASQRMYGPIPIEVALFADGGIAWNSLNARPRRAPTCSPRRRRTRSTSTTPSPAPVLRCASICSASPSASSRSPTRSSDRVGGWCSSSISLPGSKDA